MESFNEDADGLFACLLEEPGADQSVNFEVQNNSKNQSQLGGDASFGYDDGYGQENQSQQDDLGGDDGGGMSLGAQFLDLVASTIG
jgi:hypothetical protein